MIAKWRFGTDEKIESYLWSHFLTNVEQRGLSRPDGSILLIFTVYILENASGKFYVGRSNNLEV
ncbi:MAG: hypothetical protein ACXWKG_12860 [Limisphaerales bacterium]